VLVFDFETEGIEGNPVVRPPRPVGCAFKRPGFKSYYLTDMAKIAAKLRQHIDAGDEFLCHNGKFDWSVARTHLGIEMPEPIDCHDTMFQLFLADPYAVSFSLKPSAERILGWPPEEQDAVRDWVLAHVPEATTKNWGAYICFAPVEIVGPYACGDVDRTLALYQHLKDRVPLVPYQREQKLLPVLMESERRGVRLDQERLEKDTAELEGSLETSGNLVRELLGCGPSVNLDSGRELADALDAAGMVETWPLTPTGRRSTAREALLSAVTNPELSRLLAYRGALAHCLSQFGRKWVEFGKTFNGRMHPEWNQVRQMAEGGDTKGARTGRLSCGKPSFQNTPNEYDLEIPAGLSPLPKLREYILPDKGMVWLKRDYSQQELRILAHFSEGRLYQRYVENPKIDAHVETSKLIAEHTGVERLRKHVKITGFSIIYGSGIGGLADQLGVSYAEGKDMRDAYFTALPEVPVLMKACSQKGKRGEAIKTWGGREYLTEPPRMGKYGRMMSFEYKLLNYLIQGSGGDCTKESIVRWGEDRGNGEFLATVHDENNIQAPKESWKEDMGKLRQAMEGIEFDVKMLSDGFVGKSWQDLKECK